MAESYPVIGYPTIFACTQSRQTHRGLRILVEDLAQVGDYILVAENSAGAQEIQFPPVGLAERSPRPGTADSDFERPLVEFVAVTHLVPLADGSVLVGGGRIYSEPSEPRSMVGKWVLTAIWILSLGRMES